MKPSPLSRRRSMIPFALLFVLVPFGLAASSPALIVRGEVDKPLQLTLADLRAMPRGIVKAREKDGIEATFEDVALSDLIKGAKPRLTEIGADAKP